MIQNRTSKYYLQNIVSFDAVFIAGAKRLKIIIQEPLVPIILYNTTTWGKQII